MSIDNPSAVTGATTSSSGHSHHTAVFHNSGATGAPLSSPPNTPPADVLTEIPAYEILGVLGRGGMGVVYHARHALLNRDVALKVVLAGAHATPEDRVRFLAEAEAVAALSHPGVVQVYECGTHGGQP